MVSGRILFCLILVAAWQELQGARIPLFDLVRIGDAEQRESQDENTYEVFAPVELTRAKIQEGVPPPLCAGRCASPPAGPVCAFDATGTARTFATLCELEAVSCRESTFLDLQSIDDSELHQPALDQINGVYSNPSIVFTSSPLHTTNYAITSLGEC